MKCPTCGSDDRDVFLPVPFAISRCSDSWHENRIVKRRPKSRKAASRRTTAQDVTDETIQQIIRMARESMRRNA